MTNVLKLRPSVESEAAKAPTLGRDDKVLRPSFAFDDSKAPVITADEIEHIEMCSEKYKPSFVERVLLKTVGTELDTPER